MAAQVLVTMDWMRPFAGEIFQTSQQVSRMHRSLGA